MSVDRCIKVLRDHTHFIQGVAWDPLGKYLVTESADGSVKIWQASSRKSTAMAVTAFNKLCKANNESKANLFHDETLVSFFRRPAFSPDGALLLLPAGIRDNDNCIHILARSQLGDHPIVAHIYGFRRAVLGIRFNSKLFRLSTATEECNVNFRLGYRMIYAAFTMDAVHILDSTQKIPVAVVKDLHYGSITDVVWSPDGATLLVTSTDGFCSVITFEHEELGEMIPEEEQRRILKDIQEQLCGIRPIEQMPRLLRSPKSMPLEPVAMDSEMYPNDPPVSIIERSSTSELEEHSPTKEEVVVGGGGKRRIKPTFVSSF